MPHGARQVGKTTLARQVAGQSNAARFFDLENPAHLAQLADPMLALEPLRGLVILDEIQRVPDLFTSLRVLSDRPHRPAAFLVTTALEDLRLRHLFVVHAGTETFPMAPKISAVALPRITEDLRLE
jgi:predicted AAA+ superfamily ATPase